MNAKQAYKTAVAANKARTDLIAHLRNIPSRRLNAAAKRANLWNFEFKLFQFPGDITTAKLVKITAALAK